MSNTQQDKQKYSMGYQPHIEYIDEYDSSAALIPEEEKQQTYIPPSTPIDKIKDNMDRIDFFLGGLNDDIRSLIEGVYLPTKDAWEEIEESIKNGTLPPYGDIPNIKDFEITYPTDDPEPGDYPDSEDEDDRDPSLPPPDVSDDDKIDGLLHIIKIESPRLDVVKKEYVKNTADLFNLYTEGLLNTISDYWVQTAPSISGKTSEQKSYILNDFNSYKKKDHSSNVGSSNKHMLDFTIRTEIMRHQKTSFLQKMFPTDETILKLRNYTGAYELRKKYASMPYKTDASKEASDYNSVLKATTLVYDTKYDNSFLALYKYFTSSNKTLSDIMNLNVQERKAKQYLK